MTLAQVDLVSVTTNGAELEIQHGMSRALERGVRCNALAETGAIPDETMAALGFEPYAFDDRGRTFIRGGTAGAPVRPAGR